MNWVERKQAAAGSVRTLVGTSALSSDKGLEEGVDTWFVRVVGGRAMEVNGLAACEGIVEGVDACAGLFTGEVVKVWLGGMEVHVFSMHCCPAEHTAVSPQQVESDPSRHWLPQTLVQQLLFIQL